MSATTGCGARRSRLIFRRLRCAMRGKFAKRVGPKILAAVEAEEQIRA
jgi:hypothetical protein